MPSVCTRCSREVVGTSCPFCAQPVVEGTPQEERVYRWLAKVLTLISLLSATLTNLALFTASLYVSQLPRDARGGLGMVLGFFLGPVVWGVTALGVVTGVFGLINAGGSRMWYWAAAAVLGVFLSVLPFVR